MTQKATAGTNDNLDKLQVSSRTELREWLEANHHANESIWLVTFKKHCGERYIAYGEIVEELLCFGWIDSLPRKLDEDRTMLRVSPRKVGSGWSKVNKDKIDKMIAAGLMTEAGLEKIEAAKVDGSWLKLDKVDALEVPDDLRQAFQIYENAEGNFSAFPPSARRGILEWILGAKKVETRKKRIEETARLAQDNIRANQWRKK